MKRFWKIFGITLGSILAVIIIAVCIALYVVFTPSRLTPIVRNVADKYVTAEHTIGDVELTFFSTFPEFGLQINGLYVINPMQGAQSDTLLAAPNLVAKVDVIKLLKENALDVHQLKITDAFANVFIDENGNDNFSVINLPSDTLEEDTTQFSLPFSEIKVGELKLHLKSVSFISKKDSIDAFVENLSLSADADNLDDISLELASTALDATLSDEIYAEHLALSLNAPHTVLQLTPFSVTLNNASVAVNEFLLKIQGKAAFNDDIVLNAHVEADKWNVPQLMSLLPRNILSMLSGIDIDAATLSLKADIDGIYNDASMPLIDAELLLSDAQAAYKEVFPYTIGDIQLSANAHLDLNEKKNSSATINKLHAKTRKTTVDVTGKLTELLGDLFADVKLQLNANLADFTNYVEGINGVASGSVNAKYRLSALKNMQLKKGTLNGDIRLRNLAFHKDSMSVMSSDMRVMLQVPNAKPTREKVNFANVNIQLADIDFEMINQIKANLGEGKLQAELSDIISNSDVIFANLKLEDKVVDAQIDSIANDGAVNTYITANFKEPLISAYAEYNTKDDNAVPVVDADIKFGSLQAVYTDIVAHLKKSSVTASLSASKFDKTQPRIMATINTEALNASMGDDMTAQTAQLSVSAAAQRNPEKDNVLLQWNPRLEVQLLDGNVKLNSFKEQIEIPNIDFAYSNKHFNINKSHILLGNSDFSLTGDIHNIGPWLDKKDQLKGELYFTSQHTDANELMAMFSADKGSEEAAIEKNVVDENTTATEAAATDPFLVPTDVDLKFITDIKEAVVFDQLARELGGQLYIKDGILILEEMGFICNAAKLQLTAMYKTPRRNHLFVGLDYHMLDINIQELVNMIPQIDTMMPMLRSFRGDAELHLAAETYMNANYDIKPSTTRGAVSITGKDLVLLDGETFGKIAKLLMFNKKTENLVDSISVQATLFKKEIDIYPFCMSIDNYMAAVGGRHNLDMTFDYHISLLKPLYLGVDVGGNFDDLKIKLAKCRYAQDFRPIFRKDVETQNASLKKMINEALKRTVRTE